VDPSFTANIAVNKRRIHRKCPLPLPSRIPVFYAHSADKCSSVHPGTASPSKKLSQTCYISRMKWDIKYHDEKLQADVLALPPGILARYFHCTDRMMEFGPDLGMPHTRAMSSGLFELRLKSREGIGRVFFCTVVNRKIVMLLQFVKKTDKTPPKELALARKRMKEWKDADS
jgi:phage-related protein